MKTNKTSQFKRLTIVTCTVVGFVVMAYQFIQADAAEVMVAQSAKQTPESQGDTSSSESQPSDSKAEENTEAAAPPQKKLKDFRPSEEIEAEQAVDFPYDI